VVVVEMGDEDQADAFQSDRVDLGLPVQVKDALPEDGIGDDE